MITRLKVYSRIHEPAGHAIYRINREFVKRAPPTVEFVDYVKQADFQIIHCLGAGSLTKIWHKRYILFQHNFLNADISNPNVWLGVFGQAMLVVSYADLPNQLKSTNFQFHMTPWGVDLSTFVNRDCKRNTKLLTTGWSSFGEALRECYLAVKQRQQNMVNVGADFNFGEGFKAVSRLTDAELCDLYNDCEFVSGLRFNEGFEISIIEGLACGCRPICFDIPVYRKWFDGLVSFVPHCSGRALVRKLEDVLKRGAMPISRDEKIRLRTQFDWQQVVDSFWNRVLDYV